MVDLFNFDYGERLDNGWKSQRPGPNADEWYLERFVELVKEILDTHQDEIRDEFWVERAKHWLALGGWRG